MESTTSQEWLREQLPLKQGLRLFIHFHTLIDFILREQLPLKQGLRQDDSVIVNPTVMTLREQLPLKQGLRPEEIRPSLICTLTQRTTSTKTRIKTQGISFIRPFKALREQLPLKQGLRPISLSLEFPLFQTSENNFH